MTIPRRSKLCLIIFSAAAHKSIRESCCSTDHHTRSTSLHTSTNNLAISVEGVQLLREIVHIFTDTIRHEIVIDGLKSILETKNITSKIPPTFSIQILFPILSILLERDGSGLDHLLQRLLRLGKNALNTSMRVLHVHIGITIRRQHSVKVEYVVTQTVLTEIKVLDTTITELSTSILHPSIFP